MISQNDIYPIQTTQIIGLNDRLDKLLKNKGGSNKAVCVCGRDGVGKSTITKRFVFNANAKSQIPNVVYISMKPGRGALHLIHQILDGLGISEQYKQVDRALKRTRGVISAKKIKLIIIDDLHKVLLQTHGARNAETSVLLQELCEPDFPSAIAICLTNEGWQKLKGYSELMSRVPIHIKLRPLGASFLELFPKKFMEMPTCHDEAFISNDAACVIAYMNERHFNKKLPAITPEFVLRLMVASEGGVPRILCNFLVDVMNSHMGSVAKDSQLTLGHLSNEFQSTTASRFLNLDPFCSEVPTNRLLNTLRGQVV